MEWLDLASYILPSIKLCIIFIQSFHCWCCAGLNSGGRNKESGKQGLRKEGPHKMVGIAFETLSRTWKSAQFSQYSRKRFSWVSLLCLTYGQVGRTDHTTDRLPFLSLCKSALSTGDFNGLKCSLYVGIVLCKLNLQGMFARNRIHIHSF